MSDSLSPFLTAALEAALAAGESLKSKYPQRRDIQIKGPRDIVTDADFAAQKAILDVIRARFPDHAILAEEGRHDIALNRPTPTWIIDPLDGTTNYSRRFPNFTVSIALAQNGVLETGVVHDPLRGETFYAQRGAGAFLKQGEQIQRLQVSPIDKFADALVAVDWPRDAPARRRMVEALGHVVAACRTLRSIGTVALGLAYLAAGRIDAYYHLTPKVWDMAAGNLIVLEAGGHLTTFTGQPWRLSDTELVVSNGRLHPALLNILAAA